MICRTSVQDGSKIRLDARVELPFKRVDTACSVPQSWGHNVQALWCFV